MKQKILSFITDGDKFLALRNNSKDPKHGGDFWFVVTGEINKNEAPKEAVRREIKEETNLDVDIKKIVDLNWGSIYESNGEKCKEKNFISFIESKNKEMKIILNEEHTEFKWLGLDDFVKLIKWNDDKKILKKVLKKEVDVLKKFALF